VGNRSQRRSRTVPAPEWLTESTPSGCRHLRVARGVRAHPYQRACSRCPRGSACARQARRSTSRLTSEQVAVAKRMRTAVRRYRRSSARSDYPERPSIERWSRAAELCPADPLGGRRIDGTERGRRKHAQRQDVPLDSGSKRLTLDQSRICRRQDRPLGNRRRAGRVRGLKRERDHSPIDDLVALYLVAGRRGVCTTPLVDPIVDGADAYLDHEGTAVARPLAGEPTN
jgi:hypothetical protein